MTNARQALRAVELLRVLSWALLLVLCVLATACGGGDPEDQPDQPTPHVDCAAKTEVCR